MLHVYNISIGVVPRRAALVEHYIMRNSGITVGGDIVISVAFNIKQTRISQNGNKTSYRLVQIGLVITSDILVVEFEGPAVCTAV